jgi:hypothetical protein
MGVSVEIRWGLVDPTKFFTKQRSTTKMSMFTLDQGDVDGLLEQVHTETIDTARYLCPEGEYPAQAQEIRFQPGKSDKVAVTWINGDILWEIQDEKVRQQMGMSKVVVGQRLGFIHLVLDSDGSVATPARIDYGPNKSQGLKDVLEATGLSKGNFTPNKIKFQQATVRVKHELDRDGAKNADGSPVKYARVVGVVGANGGRRR